jgi:MFS family permease
MDNGQNINVPFPRSQISSTTRVSRRLILFTTTTTTMDKTIIADPSVEEKMTPSDSDKAGSTVDASGHNAFRSLGTRLDPAGNPLSPTPTSDALDPLNWPLWRKYVCIAIACFSYFLMTYLTTAPIPSFFLLEDQFNATYSQTNWTFAISAFGLIFGPLLSGGLADIYGRRICMIVTTAVALLATGCTSIHGQSLGAYMFERFLQGLGAGSACNLGLSIINDVSFQHERGLRVGLWAIAANMGTFLGGVFGGFLVSVNQYWVAYQVTIAYAVLWLLTVFVLPETLYPRRQMLNIEFGPAGNDGVEAPSPRTRKLPFFVSCRCLLSSLRSFSFLFFCPSLRRLSLSSPCARLLRSSPSVDSC